MNKEEKIILLRHLLKNFIHYHLADGRSRVHYHLALEKYGKLYQTEIN